MLHELTILRIQYTCQLYLLHIFFIMKYTHILFIAHFHCFIISFIVPYHPVVMCIFCTVPFVLANTMFIPIFSTLDVILNFCECVYTFCIAHVALDSRAGGSKNSLIRQSCYYSLWMITHPLLFILPADVCSVETNSNKIHQKYWSSSCRVCRTCSASTDSVATFNVFMCLNHALL